MKSITQYPIAQAFAGTIPGVESSPRNLAGYAGFENHPQLHPIIPTYKFNKQAVNLLIHTWVREISTRTETDPRRGIWFGGPKGVGKTTIVEQFFARLGVPVFTITCNRRVPLSDYLTKMVPDGEGGWLQVDGPILTAMKGGFPIVLSEPGAMDPADLIAMHDIIDRGLVVLDNGDVVRAERGFHVHATDNSMGFGDMTGAYAGLNTMNTATMSRFYKFYLGYPSREEEVAILHARYSEQELDTLGYFVDFANAMREPHIKGMSVVTMGTRELIDWVDVATAMDGLKHQGTNPAWFGFKTVMGGLPDQERLAAEGFFQSTFGVDVSLQ